MNEELKIKISVDSDAAVKDIDKVTDKVEDFGDESKDTAKKSDKSFDDIAKSAKVGFAAATAAIAAAGAALVGMAESTRDYRTAQGKLTTAFKTAGSDAETATKVYKELNGVLGDSDVAVEAAGHLAKLTTNEKELEKWTDICAGVFATFGDSLPIEGLTEAANETAKTGQLTGGLTDALNWAGVAEDEFQASLDACTTEQERQALITETLNGLYSEAASVYRDTNAEIIASNKATEEWNAQLAKMGGYAEPAVTSIKELGVSLLKGLEEPIKNASEWISESFIPAIKDLGKWIGENKEIIITALGAIAGGVVAYKIATEGATIATAAFEGAQKLLNAVLNANPLTLVISALGLAAGAMLAYSAATDEAKNRVDPLTEKERELVELIDDETEAINNRKTAYDEAAGVAEAEMTHTTKLADELMRLADENGKVQEADRVRADFILNELNEALGTEYKMVDGVIQKYSTLKDEVYELIEAKTANSMLEAKNEEYVAAIEAEEVALQEVTAAQKDYEAQLPNVAAAEENLEKVREKALEKFELGTESAIASGHAMIAEAERDLENEKKILNEKKEKYDEASENYATHYNNIKEYEEAAMAIQQGNYKEAIEILKNKSSGYFEYADDVSEATRKAVDALYKEAVDAGIEAKRTKTNFENGVEGYTEEMVKESKKAYEDALNAWAKAYDDANGIGKDVGSGLEDGMGSKIPNLVKKAKSLISNIWSAMRKEADSHSPSKKTMALGGDMGEGLKIGMDKSTQRTAQAAKNLVQNTLVPMEASISGVSWNNLDKAFSTTLAPIGNVNLSSETMLKVLNEESSFQPIILQVDGKTFAEISVDSINQLTKQRGNLPLVIA